MIFFCNLCLVTLILVIIRWNKSVTFFLRVAHHHGSNIKKHPSFQNFKDTFQY